MKVPFYFRGVLALLFTVAPTLLPDTQFLAHLSVLKPNSTLSQLLRHAHLSMPRCSVLSSLASSSVMVRSWSSDIVFPLAVTVPFPPYSHSLGPRHLSRSRAADGHPVLLGSVLPLTVTFPRLWGESKGGCFSSSGRENKCFVHLLWRCTFLYSTVHFRMYHSGLRHPVRPVLHGVPL